MKPSISVPLSSVGPFEGILWRIRSCFYVILVFLPALTVCPLSAHGQTEMATTGWNDGHFQVDRRSIVGRSDIILQRPNTRSSQAMPLGNGRLGLAVWAQDGYTAQLNRGDTFPLRLSPGQVVLPGLAKVANAPDYSARLNLYDGEFRQTGAGMTVTTYVDQALDVMVIDVTGADPGATETAELRLWAPRQPQVFVQGKIGGLAETWIDNKERGASGETFGSLSAITASALDLKVRQLSPLSVQLTFRPLNNGSFRIFVGSPSWRGGDAGLAASRLLAQASRISPEEHRVAWNSFWEKAGLMKLSSSDHVAEYFENLRMIDLFTAAAESRDRLPGSQAGIGDLFSSLRDEHHWGPSAYWHWNLRMQVAANLGAGVSFLNDSYFNLYRENLDNEIAWTKLHMKTNVGICVPETMRFNGQGYENETWLKAASINCGIDSPPYYNARTLSTGAEVALWMWKQYQFTDDEHFLSMNYPFMRDAALFLLGYAKHGQDGLLHTYPSNAHETQWDVHDPTTDIAAMDALFPAVIQAATILHTDSELAQQLRNAIPLLPKLPLVPVTNPEVLTRGDALNTATMIAASHDPAAPIHNTENVGLEPVWPYGLIGDDGPLHALGVRTFMNRPNKDLDDWSFDPLQATRLGLAGERTCPVL
jgi:alpha-L-fucosidase 2